MGATASRAPPPCQSGFKGDVRDTLEAIKLEWDDDAKVAEAVVEITKGPKLESNFKSAPTDAETTDRWSPHPRE